MERLTRTCWKRICRPILARSFFPEALHFLTSQLAAHCVFPGGLFVALKGTLFGDAPYFLQEDNTPSHRSRVVRDFKMQNDVKEIGRWPPCSPDLNPCDYALWSTLERRALEFRPRSVGELRNAVMRAWQELPQGRINSMMESFPTRVARCVCASGGRFESRM